MNDSQAFSEQIRRAAGYGAPTDEGAGEGEPGSEESHGDPDFGAGARRSTPSAPDMSAAIRAAWKGEWTSTG